MVYIFFLSSIIEPGLRYLYSCSYTDITFQLLVLAASKRPTRERVPLSVEDKTDAVSETLCTLVFVHYCGMTETKFSVILRV
jgi:hypothetical protein